MTGNHLENIENSSEISHSDDFHTPKPQPNNFQNNLFERISLGIFVLIGGLAYLFNFPSGTLFTTAGALMLLICLRQIISKSLTLDLLTLLIGFLCLSKGISTLFKFEITFIPILFCFLGIFIISKAWQDRSA